VDAVAKRRVAAASESSVAAAAREVLAKGNAVDAVMAGVLMAAAESRSALLGPVQILAGGAGAGLVAIDGRVRQPGLGAPRPRGFLPEEAVPDAAYVGVPALPAAVAIALATLGTASLLRAAGPALAWARSHAPERAAVIEGIARRGAPALAEDAIAGELTAAAGRVARGLLTVEDLAAVRPAVERCEERTLGESGILRVPWQGASAPDATFAHVVAAVDGRGLAAVACYEVPLDGVPVPALGLIAPRTAAPVLRGKARVAPSEPRGAAAPIALRVRSGLVELAFGVGGHPAAEASLAAVIEALETAPTIPEALRQASAGRAVAIVSTRDAARVLASA
jgi:gamma-glutamyltranspeptidase/glutathione hydrolase